MSYRTTIVLGAVLVALVALVYFFELRDADQTGTPTSEQPVPLVQLSAADVNHVDIKQGEQSLTLFRAESGGQWRLASPTATAEKGEEADQDRVERVVSSLASLSASRVVNEQPSGLEEYGLAQPEVEVVLQTIDGKREALRFGNTNPGGNGRYAQLEGSQKVYMVYSYVVDDVTRMLVDPPLPRPTPTPISPLVTPTGTITPPEILSTPTP